MIFSTLRTQFACLPGTVFIAQHQLTDTAVGDFFGPGRQVQSFSLIFRPHFTTGVSPVYVPGFFRGRSGRLVQVLQACCGVAYRRSFFQDSIENIPPSCWTTDDLWISGYLALFANVSRIAVAEYLPGVSPPQKGRDPARLSRINNWLSGNDKRCIGAIEREFGNKWD